MDYIDELNLEHNYPVLNQKVDSYLYDRCSDAYRKKVKSAYPSRFFNNPWFIRLLEVLRVGGGFTATSSHEDDGFRRYYDPSTIPRDLPPYVYTSDVDLEGEYPGAFEKHMLNNDMVYLFFCGNGKRLSIVCEVDYRWGEFWPMVHWSEGWSQDQKIVAAEYFLGGYFDANGDLQPSPTAFSSDLSGFTDEKALSYLRSRQGVDYHFLNCWKSRGDDDVVYSYAQELMGLERELSSEKFKSIVEVFNKYSEIYFPSLLTERRSFCLHVLNTLDVSYLTFGSDLYSSFQIGVHTLVISPDVSSFKLFYPDGGFYPVSQEEFKTRHGHKESVLVYKGDLKSNLMDDLLFKLFHQGTLSGSEWSKKCFEARKWRR